jgi:hypothetical protein
MITSFSLERPKKFLKLLRLCMEWIGQRLSFKEGYEGKACSGIRSPGKEDCIVPLVGDLKYEKRKIDATLTPPSRIDPSVPVRNSDHVHKTVQRLRSGSFPKGAYFP